MEAMLINNYNISSGFYNRYLIQNAEFRYGVEMLQFLYFKKGNFLSPAKKKLYIHNFLNDEIKSFYEKNIINIPQLEFCITTRCSLACQDCSSLIPYFVAAGHINLEFVDFKRQLDKICNSVTRIRRFVLFGGEPLLHKDIALMLDYACLKDNIDVVEIISNGTLLPSEDLLNAMRKHNKKTYLYISNYSSNQDLLPRLKHEQIKNLLKQYDIKLQMVSAMGWYKELGFSKNTFDDETTLKHYKNCFCGHCTQVLNGKIYICSKASCALELGMIDVSDYIDIDNSLDLRQEFISFYNKDFADACRYCIMSDKSVLPALQGGE